MPRFKTIALAALCSLAIAAFASAHTIEELQSQLGEREKYFQPVDKPAPDFALQDAEGRPAALSDFRGRIVVLHFIYTSCPDVCPLHAERIAEIQALVNRTPMKELVQFVSITTDPRNDTPEVLAGYGAAHGLEPANWTFLTSGPDRPEDATRTLAAAYGHRFTKTEDGMQMHAVVTHVIDREGRWRANFHGLKFAPVNLVTFVNALSNEGHPHGPAEQPGIWDRLRALF